MNKPNKKPVKKAKLSDAELLALAASQIKGKVLFPEKMERGLYILTHCTWSK